MLPFSFGRPALLRPRPAAASAFLALSERVRTRTARSTSPSKPGSPTPASRCGRLPPPPGSARPPHGLRHVDCYSLLGWIVAGPLWHRLTLKHAVQFEPKVIVQAPRPMFLNNERQLASRLPRSIGTPTRFWCDGEIALPLMWIKVSVPLHAAMALSQLVSTRYRL